MPAEEEEAGDANGWMIGFSDMITLLMTFFVLLISMSSLDSKSIKESIQHFQAAAGVMDKGAAAPRVVDISVVSPIMPTTDLQRLQHYVKTGGRATSEDVLRLHNLINEKGLDDLIKLIESPHRLELHVREDLVFAPNSELFVPAGKRLLMALSEAIDSTELAANRTLRVEVSAVEEPSEEADLRGSWGLALERAIRVVRYFERNTRLTGRQLMPLGHGRDLHPLKRRAAAEQRGAVSFVLVETLIPTSHGGLPSDSTGRALDMVVPQDADAQPQ